MSIIVGDHYFHAGGNPAGRGQSLPRGFGTDVVVALVERRDIGQGLRRAIDLDEDRTESFDQPLDRRRRHRCRAIGQVGQRRKVIPAAAVQIEQPIQQRGHQERMRDAFALHDLAPGIQVRTVQRVGRSTGIEGLQERDKAGMRQRCHGEVACALVEIEVGLDVGAIAQRRPVVDRVHRALAASRRPAGEPEHRNVGLRIELDVVVAVRRRLDEVPEAVHVGRQTRHTVHCHDGTPLLAQQVVIRVEHPGLDEHRLRPDVPDLPGMFLHAVAYVAEGECCLLLIDRGKMQQAQAVVVEDQQRRIVASQPKRVAHHIGDAIGQAVILRIPIASLSLDVDQRDVVSVPQGHRRHYTAIVGFHGLLSIRAGAARPTNCQWKGVRRKA